MNDNTTPLPTEIPSGSNEDGHDPDAWAREFAVTRMQIDDAVKAVGLDKAEVEMYLKGTRSTTNSDVTQEGS